MKQGKKGNAEPVEILETKLSEKFLLAVDKTFGEEGGLSNHKRDKGGITKYGISFAFLKAEGIDVDGDGDIDKDDILVLSEEDAMQLYAKFFWNKLKCEKISDEKLAQNVFDTGVNCGTQTAGRLLQTVANHLGANIAIDGIVGEKTINAVTKIDAEEANKHFVEERISHYEGIVARDTTQRVFLNGWINRAKKFI